MLIIKRRFFLKNIFYLFSGFISFFYLKKIKNNEDYLSTFLNQIDLPRLNSENINNTLKKINYSYHENFITNYRASNVNSFEEFSIWLSERIKNDYSKNKLVFIDNMFLSETEVSLLIIKYT